MAIATDDKLITLGGLKQFKSHLNTYKAGDNITFTPDATNPNKITISSSITTATETQINSLFKKD